MDQNIMLGVAGLNFRPLLFLLYINDLPLSVKHKALPILFADNTSILKTSPSSNQLQSDLNIVFAWLNKWLTSNLLFFNFDKPILFDLIMQVNAPQLQKLNMKMNK